MADRIWQVSFFFESQQQATVGTGSSLGWQEVWYKTYLDTVGIETVIQSADFTDYLKLRTAFMPNIYRCAFIRVSDVSNPRHFKIRAITGNLGTGDVNEENSGQVQCAVLVNMDAIVGPGTPGETIHHRKFLVRALAKDLVNGNVIQNESDDYTFLKRFLNFVAHRPAGQPVNPAQLRFTWGIRWNTQSNVSTTILRMKEDPGSLKRSWLVDPPTNLPRGTKMVIKGIPRPNEDGNRTWTIQGHKTVDTVVYDVVTGNRRPIDVDYTGPGPGRYTLIDWNSKMFDQYTIIGLRTKKTGRSFRQLRGRR